MLLSNISMGDASLVAVLGYAVVFFGLILLMLVVTLVGKFFTASSKRQTVSSAPAVQEPAQPPAAPEAPGTAGQLKLHNVDPKTAAMLMAITANKLQKPINELRFLSIKEVSE